MAHKSRKIRKARGSRTCGYGNTQKHRGAGSRGGRGLAGGTKHKIMHFTKYLPDHYGRRGFVSLKKIQNEDIKTINLDRINELAGDKGSIIDLTAMGYDKLLGRGNIQKPVKIKVAYFSKKALEKIEKVGGSITKE